MLGCAQYQCHTLLSYISIAFCFAYIFGQKCTHLCLKKSHPLTRPPTSDQNKVKHVTLNRLFPYILLSRTRLACTSEIPSRWKYRASGYLFFQKHRTLKLCRAMLFFLVLLLKISSNIQHKGLKKIEQLLFPLFFKLNRKLENQQVPLFFCIAENLYVHPKGTLLSHFRFFQKKNEKKLKLAVLSQQQKQ